MFGKKFLVSQVQPASTGGIQSHTNIHISKKKL